MSNHNKEGKMQDIYSDRSYGEDKVGFGERLGILVVDFQKAFTDGRFPMGGSDRIDKAVENTARLLSVAREKNIPVASCFVAYPNLASMPYWKVGALRKHYLKVLRPLNLIQGLQTISMITFFKKKGRRRSS